MARITITKTGYSALLLASSSKDLQQLKGELPAKAWQHKVAGLLYNNLYLYIKALGSKGISRSLHHAMEKMDGGAFCRFTDRIRFFALGSFGYQ